jgi:hypothetical protein
VSAALVHATPSMDRIAAVRLRFLRVAAECRGHVRVSVLFVWVVSLSNVCVCGCLWVLWLSAVAAAGGCCERS